MAVASHKNIKIQIKFDANLYFSKSQIIKISLKTKNQTHASGYLPTKTKHRRKFLNFQLCPLRGIAHQVSFHRKGSYVGNELKNPGEMVIGSMLSFLTTWLEKWLIHRQRTDESDF